MAQARIKENQGWAGSWGSWGFGQRHPSLWRSLAVVEDRLGQCLFPPPKAHILCAYQSTPQLSSAAFVLNVLTSVPHPHLDSSSWRQPMTLSVRTSLRPNTVKLKHSIDETWIWSLSKGWSYLRDLAKSLGACLSSFCPTLGGKRVAMELRQSPKQLLKLTRYKWANGSRVLSPRRFLVSWGLPVIYWFVGDRKRQKERPGLHPFIKQNKTFIVYHRILNGGLNLACPGKAEQSHLKEILVSALSIESSRVGLAAACTEEEKQHKMVLGGSVTSGKQH